VAVAGLCLALSGTVGYAHHAVQASVDIDKQINMKATLTKVDWINPHTWMHFEVTDPATGKVTKVLVESLGINALKQAGVDSKSALQVGEQYDISFYPNRDGTLGGFMYKMTLPDGRVLDVTTTDPAFKGKAPTN
jgi:hypothetical protein